MLLSAEHLSINFGSRQLLDDVNFYLNEGDKVGVIGINGTGKSTFLKVLSGVTEPDGGTISRNPNVQVSLLPQNPAMEESATVLEQVFLHFPAEFRELNEYEAKAMLNRLGITDFAQKVGTLSGGQRKRVALAAALIHPADVLILDEPTNHLDIYTRENLTEALMAYTGTLLLVTHDRHLMNSLACPILYLEDGKAVIYPSYDALMGRAAPAPVAEKSSEPAKAGYGKEQRRRRAELRAKIKACEDEMEACGAREVELENEINSPEVYNDPQLLREKSDELSDLRFHQDELFAAWEAAVEEQEQYEQTAGGEE